MKKRKGKHEVKRRPRKESEKSETERNLERMKEGEGKTLLKKKGKKGK